MNKVINPSDMMNTKSFGKQLVPALKQAIDNMPHIQTQMRSYNTLSAIKSNSANINEVAKNLHLSNNPEPKDYTRNLIRDRNAKDVLDRHGLI